MLSSLLERNCLSKVNSFLYLANVSVFDSMAVITTTKRPFLNTYQACLGKCTSSCAVGTMDAQGSSVFQRFFAT